MLSHHAKPIAPRATNAAPTTIPAFAPVARPLPPPEPWQEPANCPPGVLVEVTGTTDVDEPVPVTMAVIVVKLCAPFDALESGVVKVV